jgi:1-deoxy-D-xylulose-5-phosphate synthase
MQRAYDQMIHDVDLQNLDVTYAVDRAGQVGADGATHAGIFDLTYCRTLPNMVVMTPADEAECRLMLQTAWEYEGPAMVRYPRGGGPGVSEAETLETIEIGKAEERRRGEGVALLAFGTMLPLALELGDELDATVINMRFVKPLDEALVAELAGSHRLLVTLEENMVQGGAGSAVTEYLNTLPKCTELLQLGLPDRYIEHGTQQEQMEDAGLEREQLLPLIRQRLDTIG